MSVEGAAEHPRDAVVGRLLRVAFYGEFGCGNLGNEASLTAAIAWFVSAGVRTQMSAFARGPEYVEAVHHLDARPMYGTRADTGWRGRLPRSLTHGLGKISDQLRFALALRHIDLVVLPGMGVFESELGGPAWGLPFTLFSATLMCRLTRTPFTLVGVGGSSEPRAIVRWMNRSTFRYSSFVSFRDTFSRDSLIAQGVPVEGAPVYPDIVFGLRSLRPRTDPPGPLTVGLGVLSFYDPADWKLGEQVRMRYEATMAEFARWLLSAGHRIHILIGDGSDQEVAERLIAILVEEYPACRDDGSLRFSMTTDHGMLQRQIERVDVVIASRYHNLVFALKSGCPTISVSYAPKCTKLMESAGFGEFAQAIESVSSDCIKRNFEEIAHNYQDFAQRVAAFAQASAQTSDLHRDRFMHEMVTNHKLAATSDE